MGDNDEGKLCGCLIPAKKKTAWTADEIGRRYWCCPKQWADPSNCRLFEFIDDPFPGPIQGLHVVLRNKLCQYMRVMMYQKKLLREARKKEVYAMVMLNEASKSIQESEELLCEARKRQKLADATVNRLFILSISSWVCLGVCLAVVAYVVFK